MPGGDSTKPMPGGDSTKPMPGGDSTKPVPGGDSTNDTAGPMPGKRGGDLPGTPMDPNEANKKRAGDLNLDKVDKEKLKKLFEKYGVTEKEWNEYVAQKLKATKADLLTGNRAGTSAVNQGPKRVQTGADGNDPLSAGRTGNAPPEYKDAAEEFAKRLATGAPAKKSK